MEALFGLFVFVILLLIGLVIGGSIEAAHFRRLEERERQFGQILLSDAKHLPSNWKASDPVLVVGEAVVATDYFKVFAGGLRKIFGGDIRGYERLVDRARREALARMREQAAQFGANTVWSVRIETSTIQGKQQQKSGGVEVLAYGTAMKVVSK